MTKPKQVIAEAENKFIVLNIKRLKEIDAHMGDEYGTENPSPPVRAFIHAVNTLNQQYHAAVGKPMPNNSYVVCNNDEPYAKEVWDVILKGEQKKINDQEESGARKV